MRGARIARSAARARARAFTLVELVVAMVAGLIVALSVVALSREASDTFHEETRVAAAEMQIRTAIDRLRADLGRASFMSTGNIYIDPNDHDAGHGTDHEREPGLRGRSDAVPEHGTRHVALATSPGFASSRAGGELPARTDAALDRELRAAGLGPDAIDLAGNMTGVEVLADRRADRGTTGHDRGGRVQRSAITPRRELVAVALASRGMSPSTSDDGSTTYQNLAERSSRSRDNNGLPARRRHRSSSASSTTRPTRRSTQPPARRHRHRGTARRGRRSRTSTSPRTRSRSRESTPTPRSTRSRSSAGRSARRSSTRRATPAATRRNTTSRASTSTRGEPGRSRAEEVIAEYAVDLKFAFTVDNLSDLTGDYSTAASSPLLVNAFEDSSNGVITNQTAADDASKSVAPYASGTEPQRIRSVRVRLVTRAAMQDRSEPLAVSGAPNDYLYRYCLVNSAATCLLPAPIFARTRTLISEVALPNQSRLWFR